MPAPTLEKLAKALETEELVTLDVNPDSEAHKQYKVQRTLLVNSSPWFEKALSGNWSESTEKRVALRDVDPSVVEQFLYFLMRNEILLGEHNHQNELTAIRLWVFADRHFLPKLQNHAMKYLHSNLCTILADTPYPSTDIIAEALDGSTPGSALYRLMLAVVTWGLNNGSVYEDTTSSTIHMGRYTSEEVVKLERIPGLMTTLLYQSMLGGKPASRRLSLDELLVKEN